MGIHGEPGVEKTKIMTAAEIASALTGKILTDYDYSGAEVAVMINGLGATPLMELYILNNEVEKILSSRGISIYRTFVGNFMTSLEMAGCSVTLLKLDPELKELLDYPCSTAALKIV
jgi:dihydroxyacetone kinase-like protein